MEDSRRRQRNLHITYIHNLKLNLPPLFFGDQSVTNISTRGQYLLLSRPKPQALGLGLGIVASERAPCRGEGCLWGPSIHGFFLFTLILRGSL